jgi:hypothetical protein
MKETLNLLLKSLIFTDALIRIGDIGLILFPIKDPASWGNRRSLLAVQDSEEESLG